MKIKEEIMTVMQEISNNGYEIYLVGGAVRDQLLNIENKDYDLCTNASLTEIKKLYPNFKIMNPNNHRNTGILKINNIDIEISEYRGKTLKEDLSNRDFTINSIVVDKNGNIIDYFDGKKDLKLHTIKLIKENGAGLIMDPLRILRAIRLSENLNFKIDENTKNMMDKYKEKLNDVSKERIYNEFCQILLGPNPSKAIRENLNIFFEILPELKPSYKFNQNSKWHIYDVLEHTLVALENTPPNLYVRLTILFHDLGKPFTYTLGEDGHGHFPLHNIESVKLFEKISKRLHIDKKTYHIVKKLILKHDQKFSLKPRKIYNYIKENGKEFIDLLFLVMKADNLGQNPYFAKDDLKLLEQTKKIYQKYIDIIENMEINRKDLLANGYRGIIIKNILDDINLKVIEGKIPNNKKVLQEYIKQKYPLK